MTTLDMKAVIARIDERKVALGGLSDRATCIAAGLKPTVLADIRRKGIEPSAGKLLALATALNCSLDYLATGRNPPLTSVSHEDLGILQQLHSLSSEQQAMVRRMLFRWANRK